MKITKENPEELINRQIKVIDNLQEKIKLLQFDISQHLKKINFYKSSLKRREEAIRKAREELIIMRSQNDYKNINYVLRVLQEVEHEK